MTPATPRVLLVDDDKFLLDMYSMKFVKEGFTVQACLSVHSALEALRGGFTPDAVLFDLTMPEQDGFSFLTTMKRENLATSAKRIALTNQSSEEEKAKAKELGADDFIIKATMIPSEVVAAVREKLSHA
jgi:two-component system chemotaxis response regulator CheY